jgi:hypothetical protein
MDRRITIGVVAVLALLGGYIWYTFLRSDAPPVMPVTPEPTPALFLSIESVKVQAVEVRDVKSNAVTRVVRDGEKWKMAQPAQGEAFADPVDELLYGLARIDVDRQLGVQSDLTPFGLNPAAYELRVTLEDSSVVTVSIGNKNPDGNSFYALKGGDGTVYLIRSSIGERIQDLVNTPPYTPTPTVTPTATGTPAP